MAVEEELSVSAMHRIIQKARAERVSVSACIELASVLEKLGLRIGRDALDFSMHAGRKTVKGRDIKIAAKKYTG